MKCAHIPLPLVTLITSTNKSVCLDVRTMREIGKKWETVSEYSTSMSAFRATKIHNNKYNSYPYNNHNNLYNVFHRGDLS